jgi:phospholipid/cholesterol/gamma-HCH transport system permease protein
MFEHDPALVNARPATTLQGLLEWLSDLGALVLTRLGEWRRTVWICAELMATALQPSFWRNPLARRALAHEVVEASAGSLLWFALMVALGSTVITRIVYVTAQSYGLSALAVEMLVRVLVIELIPLTAALVVALRYSITRGSELFKRRHRGKFNALQASGLDPVALWVVPSALAGMLAVFTLAAVCAAVAMFVTYFMIYGLSPHGLDNFVRGVGKVFSPSVVVIFATKTLFFAAAVSLTPMATALQNLSRDTSRVGVALRVLVRVFAMLLLVEVLSLAGNYA